MERKEGERVGRVVVGGGKGERASCGGRACGCWRCPSQPIAGQKKRSSPSRLS